MTQVQMNTRNPSRDFHDVIMKLQDTNTLKRQLDITDISVIKYISKYGYNEEVSTILRGAANQNLFSSRNGPVYSWVNRSLRLTVLAELERVQNLAIKDNCSINNLLND